MSESGSETEPGPLGLGHYHISVPVDVKIPKPLFTALVNINHPPIVCLEVPSRIRAYKDENGEVAYALALDMRNVLTHISVKVEHGNQAVGIVRLTNEIKLDDCLNQTVNTDMVAARANDSTTSEETLVGAGDQSIINITSSPIQALNQGPRTSSPNPDQNGDSDLTSILEQSGEQSQQMSP